MSRMSCSERSGKAPTSAGDNPATFTEQLTGQRLRDYQAQVLSVVLSGRHRSRMRSAVVPSRSIRTAGGK